jgi:cell division protein FtsQ
MANSAKNWLSHFRWLLFFILGPALLVGAFFLIQRDGIFRISEVKVSMMNAALSSDSAAIERLPLWISPLWQDLSAELGQLQFRDLWSLQASELEPLIKKHPWVANWTIEKKWPSQLIVQVSVRPLVAYAKNKKGNLIPLFANGDALTDQRLSHTMNLPLIQIPLDDKAKIAETLLLLQKIDPALLARLSEISWDAKEGFITVMNPLGTRVRWGDHMTEQKIFRLIKVLNELDQRQVGARVIDANLAKKVVVRLRKTP